MPQKILDHLNRTGGLLVSLSNFLESATPDEIDDLDGLFGVIDRQNDRDLHAAMLAVIPAELIEQRVKSTSVLAGAATNHEAAETPANNKKVVGLSDADVAEICRAWIDDGHWMGDFLRKVAETYILRTHHRRGEEPDLLPVHVAEDLDDVKLDFADNVAAARRIFRTQPDLITGEAAETGAGAS